MRGEALVCVTQKPMPPPPTAHRISWLGGRVPQRCLSRPAPPPPRIRAKGNCMPVTCRQQNRLFVPVARPVLRALAWLSQATSSQMRSGDARGLFVSAAEGCLAFLNRTTGGPHARWLSMQTGRARKRGGWNKTGYIHAFRSSKSQASVAIMVHREAGHSSQSTCRIWTLSREIEQHSCGSICTAGQPSNSLQRWSSVRLRVLQKERSLRRNSSQRGRW